jgi:hypothetical protein
MASFAKIGDNNEVLEVLSVNNEVITDANGQEQEALGINFLTQLTGHSNWKQCSYNNNFRKCYPGIGFTYDEVKDAFIPIKPFNSWVLDENTWRWEPPVALPTEPLADNLEYFWNEAIVNWDTKERTVIE